MENGNKEGYYVEKNLKDLIEKGPFSFDHIFNQLCFFEETWCYFTPLFPHEREKLLIFLFLEFIISPRTFTVYLSAIIY